MTLREKQAKFLFYEAQLILFAVKCGCPIVRLEWMRSIETQRQYVARGASKTMDSMHLKGLASDFCFLADLQDDGKLNYDNENYRMLGEYWEGLSPDCKWGGRFGDNPATQKIEGWDAGHFQVEFR